MRALSPLHYRLVFDAGLQSVDWRLITLESFGFAAILGVLCIAWKRAYLSKTKAVLGILIVASALAVWWGGALWQERLRVAAANALAYRSSVVEGPIADFEGGKFHIRPESFRVGSVRFQYWAYSSGWGFNRTVQVGGPLREGLYVRIHYVGSDILRLEVAAEGVPVP
jgi:hypothetical protein